jgi:hypothetical protein
MRPVRRRRTCRSRFPAQTCVTRPARSVGHLTPVGAGHGCAAFLGFGKWHLNRCGYFVPHHIIGMPSPCRGGSAERYATQLTHSSGSQRGASHGRYASVLVRPKAVWLGSQATAEPARLGGIRSLVHSVARRLSVHALAATSFSEPCLFFRDACSATWNV